MAYGAVGTCHVYKISCKGGYMYVETTKNGDFQCGQKFNIRKKLNKIQNKYTLMHI